MNIDACNAPVRKLVFTYFKHFGLELEWDAFVFANRDLVVLFV